IVQGTLGDVLDVREHQDDLLGPCARVDAGQELACVLQFDVDLLFSHVDLPILGVCEGSLFSIDPVIGGGAVLSVSASPKAASAPLTAVNRPDTVARSTGPSGPAEAGGMVTIRPATPAAGEDKDPAGCRTPDRGCLPRRRARSRRGLLRTPRCRER